jgi:hypothetical protein
MRPKVLFAMATLALLILAPAVYFHLKPEATTNPSPAPAPAVTENSTPAANAGSSILNRIAHRQSDQGLPERSQAPDPTKMDHATYVQQRKADLMEMGASSDPAALKTILSELENNDAEIRGAALDSTLQFGSRDAIPDLQREYNWSTDPQEKVNIQKAIDFLQLPHFGSGELSQQSDGQSPVAH